MNMNQILSAAESRGNNGIKVTAHFGKRVQVKDYESETFSIDLEASYEKPLSGVEITMLSKVMEAKAMFAVYTTCLVQGFMTQTEYNERIASLEESTRLVRAKLEKISGESFGELFGD